MFVNRSLMPAIPSGNRSENSAIAILILKAGCAVYFFVCPRAKMLATKVSTSVALVSLYP